MNDINTCSGKNLMKFSSCTLSVENIAYLTDVQPQAICFTKTEGNLFQFISFSPVRTLSWPALKEEMEVEFSTIITNCHATLALITSRKMMEAFHHSDTYGVSYYSTVVELLLNVADKLEIDLFSSQLMNEKIARRVICRLSKSVSHIFQMAWDEKKN